MIDHMIFDSKKYYEGDEKNYIGKTIKTPRAEIGCGRMTSNEGWFANFSVFPQGKVIGQMVNGQNIYLVAENTHLDSGDYAYFKLSDLIQNGGVRHSLLVRVYHVVSRLGRRLAWQ